MRVVLFLSLFLLVSGCGGKVAKHLRPVSASVQKQLMVNDLNIYAPIMIRLFKESSELEVWKEGPDGYYVLLNIYEICRWSGVLGPKIQEGDMQAPEGFYMVRQNQMNPSSNYYLSFDLGFPNMFDRTHDRTGTYLMVHGGCSSVGCYAVTDRVMSDVYALARHAFEGGQEEFQVQAFPFRMTEENFRRYEEHPHYDFWLNLKEGYDFFETYRRPPEVGVCGERYVFNARRSVEDGGAPYPPTPC